MAEREAEKAHERLVSFDAGVSLHTRKILKETRPEQKNNLEPSLRGLYEEREKLKSTDDYWKNVVRLKTDILRLPGVVDGKSAEKEPEADRIARTAITAFEELRKQYTMIRPAVLQNMLINSGLKAQGFCWHWARDLTKRLNRLGLHEFELHWATAYEAKLREHNTVVITAPGRDIRDGLLLDGWRHSGKPFWTRVEGDHYPWKPGAYLGDDSLE